MDYIDGDDAKNILKHYSSDEKMAFVRQLKENINKMNTAVNDQFPAADVKERALSNTRWNILPDKIVTQIRELIKSYDMQNTICRSGDQVVCFLPY